MKIALFDDTDEVRVMTSGEDGQMLANDRGCMVTVFNSIKEGVEFDPEEEEEEEEEEEDDV